MSILREINLVGNERIDVPMLRSIESGVKNDFDLLAGQALSGKKALVLKGFTIATNGVAGLPAEQLQLNVADSFILHFNAGESGTIFATDSGVSSETLNATNGKVVGTFVSNSINYIGLDLTKSPDPTTSDTVQVWSPLSKTETPQTLPLARTMGYRIIISTQNFTVSSNVLPIAQVETDSSNAVLSVTDARQMMFRLGSGGDNVNAISSYNWGNRTENPVTYNLGGADPFVGEDKSIDNLKSWIDAIMTSIWEGRGGEKWYSNSHRDNVKAIYGPDVLTANQDNFYFPNISVTATNITRAGSTVTVTFNNHPFSSGNQIDVKSSDPLFPAGTKTITGTTVNTFTYTEAGTAGSSSTTIVISSIRWKAISLVFENSSGWFNTINNNETQGVALPDGSALYVDIVRESNASINMAVGNLTTLGGSTIPGRRHIIAWRRGDFVFIRDRAYELGRSQFVAASPSVLGVVRLNQIAATPSSPVVVSIMPNGRIEVTATGGANAATFTGSLGGNGVIANGGASGGRGLEAVAVGTGEAVYASAQNGNSLFAQNSNGTCIEANVILDGNAIEATAAGSGHGLVAVGGTGGDGIRASTANPTGAAIFATATNGITVNAVSTGTGVAINGSAYGSPTTSIGVLAYHDNGGRAFRAEGGGNGQPVAQIENTGGGQALTIQGGGNSGDPMVRVTNSGGGAIDSLLLEDTVGGLNSHINVSMTDPDSALGGGIVVDINGTGGASGVAGINANASDTHSAIRCAVTGTGNAIQVGAGHAKFIGAQTVTNGILPDTLTKTNVPKVHGTIITGASPALLDGYCVNSFSQNATSVQVNFTSAMANTNYTVLLSMAVPSHVGYTVTKNLTNFIIQIYTYPAGTLVNPVSTICGIDFLVMGRQS